MHRLRSPLSRAVCSWVLALLAMVTAPPSLAQNADEEQAPDCTPFEKQLNQTRETLAQAQRDLRSFQGQASKLDEAQEALEQASLELSQSRAEANACQAAREGMCTSAQAFVRSVSQGQLQSEGLSGCIDPADRRALVEQLSGWTNVTKVLARMQAYSSGESDVPPSMGPMSGSRAESLLAQSLDAQGRAPLMFRRILLEAVELLAPRFFAILRAKPGGVDSWFDDPGGLSEEFASEVRGGDSDKADKSSASAPLTTALELISTYELLGECGTHRAARDCRRASQLRSLINASGPLVASRRIEEVWSSDCSSLSSSMVGGWLRDLPTTKKEGSDEETVTSVVRSKLVTCFLRDSNAPDSFAEWLEPILPAGDDLRVSAVQRLEQLDKTLRSGSPGSACGRAVRALQNLPAQSSCTAKEPFLDALEAWAASNHETDSFDHAVCDRYARALWAGESVTIGNTFSSPPTIEDAVLRIDDAPISNVKRLRDLCHQRVGQGKTFADSVVQMSSIGQDLGENPKLAPWFVAHGRAPVEDIHAHRASTKKHWIKSWFTPGLACSVLELDDKRCDECRELPVDNHYDCNKVEIIETSWRKRSRLFATILAFSLLLGALLATFLRYRSAYRRHGKWHEQTTQHLNGMGLKTTTSPARYLFPSRLKRILLQFPPSDASGHWGNRALVVRAQDEKLREADVNQAGALGQSLGTPLVLLVHHDTAAPDLGAVRAMLDWAARGGKKAVQILAISQSRLSWTKSAPDLLELADESSLRANPFEVRGRVTSSSQFFDRERLVSGLLASAQAGQFSVITGLRRFGKSSLALEVARRLPGPAAYVDLAGFHHEIRCSDDPSHAADAILRYACSQLLVSAQERTEHEITLRAPEDSMASTTLSAWFRDLMQEVAKPGEAKSPPSLLIFDEVEQAIGASEKLGHSLEVLAILIGRLRNSLPGTSLGSRARIGVIFSSALHPLLWSPLGTLAHQSIVGSFQYVSVPCLPQEAAVSMMQALGARQGIRFSEDALQLIVQESQGVPLLARRLGTSVLELYDPDRARQGALGAVQIGIEGVRAALDRETEKGSPSRVWIESEIAQPRSPGGTVLRALARVEWLDATEVRRIASLAFHREFEANGIAQTLHPDEILRRAEEAGAVTVRILGESGLLLSRGDLTEPDGYELPPGIIRRILQDSDVK